METILPFIPKCCPIQKEVALQTGLANREQLRWCLQGGETGMMGMRCQVGAFFREGGPVNYWLQAISLPPFLPPTLHLDCIYRNLQRQICRHWLICLIYQCLYLRMYQRYWIQLLNINPNQNYHLCNSFSLNFIFRNIVNPSSDYRHIN